MDGVALTTARAFDFVLAARCARARLYCGEPSPEFRQTMIRFILNAQGSDGAFLSAANLQPRARAAPDLAFVVTCMAGVQALWTLAEFTRPGFRLMASLPPGPGDLSSDPLAHGFACGLRSERNG